MQLFEPLFDVTRRAVGQLTDQGGPVHPDAAMDAPGFDRSTLLREGSLPGGYVWIIRIDQRSSDVEEHRRSARFSHMMLYPQPVPLTLDACDAAEFLRRA